MDRCSAFNESRGTLLWEGNGLKGLFKVDQIENAPTPLVAMQPVEALASYFSSRNPKKRTFQSDRIHVLDATSGQVLWTHNGKVRFFESRLGNSIVALTDGRTVSGREKITGRVRFSIRVQTKDPVDWVRLVDDRKILLSLA